MAGFRCDGWLLHGDKVLASAEIARTRSERRKGLIGRDQGFVRGEACDGVLVLPVRWIHTFGLGVAIDAVYLDRDNTIVRISTVPAKRLCLPCPSARSVIEAPAGVAAEWGVSTGDTLEIR